MSLSENWSEYWQNEGASGEVFVNKDGSKHPALKTFWKDKLEELEAGSSLIDIACGGGSIFSDLPNPKMYDLHAADFAESAIRQIQKRFDNVTTYQCSASDIPVESSCFDVAVSQFGIEYAGNEAFAEAARILKPGGKFFCLAHIQHGFIDTRNKTELEAALAVVNTGFIERAITVTDAIYKDDKALLEQAFPDFTAVEPIIAQAVQQVPRGVHVHLYNGYKTMMSKPQAYAREDIISWLEAMRSDVQKNIQRITEIRKVALSEQQVEEVVNLMVKHGMQNVEYKPFTLIEHQLPLAWFISATKDK